MADDEGQDVKEILRLLDEFDRIAARYEKLNAIAAKPNSVLAADDKLSHPIQLGHLVQYAILAAVDNLRAVAMILRFEPGSLSVPVVALYPNLRATLEASAVALWLVGPEDQRERIVRLLRVRHGEFMADVALFRGMFAENQNDEPQTRRWRARERQNRANSDKVRRNYLTNVAKAAGVESAEYQNKFPAWRALLLEAAGHSAFARRPEFVASIWSYASGLSHPSASRALFAVDLEVVAENDNDVLSTMMRSKLRPLAVTYLVALQLLDDALAAWNDRKVRPAPR